MEFDSDDTEIDTEMASTIDSRAGSTLPTQANSIGHFVEDEFPGVSGVTTAREAMKKMPEEDRAKVSLHDFVLGNMEIKCLKFRPSFIQPKTKLYNHLALQFSDFQVKYK